MAQILPVYAIIVLIFYSWTILWFFWKYPSWIYFMTLDEILLAFAYPLTNCFFESLTIILALIVLAVLLPKKWFYDDFVARSVALILPIAGYMIYLAYQFTGKLAFPLTAIYMAPIIICLTIAIVFLVGKSDRLKRVLEMLAERATIFVYISIPLSIISTLVVGILFFLAYV